MESHVEDHKPGCDNLPLKEIETKTTTDEENEDDVSRGKCLNLGFFSCKRYGGILLGISQGVLFAIGQVVAKWTIIGTLVSDGSTESDASLVLLLLRVSFETAILFLVLVIFFRHLQHPCGFQGERRFVLLNALFYTGVQVFVYKALCCISPITSSVILKSNVATTIMARIILRERLTVTDILLVLLSLSGLLTLVLGPVNNIEEKVSKHSVYVSLCFAFCAMLSLSACFVVNRRILQTSSVTINFVQSVCLAVIVLIITFATKQFIYEITWVRLAIIAGMAVSILMGHLCLVRALQIENAAIVSLASTSEIPAVFLLQTIVTRTWPSTSIIIGSTIVTIALLAVPFRQSIQKQFEKCLNILLPCYRFNYQPF